MYNKIIFILISISITLITLFSYQNYSLAQNEETITNNITDAFENNASESTSNSPDLDYLFKDYPCEGLKGGC